MEDIETTETTNSHSEALAEEHQTVAENETAVEIPQIYLYDRITKEYTGMEKAEKDPAESKKQGKFVPLVNAGATLLAPPETGENETAVFNAGVWEIKPDYRRNYKKVDSSLNVSDITAIGEIEEGYILAENELAEEIGENSGYYYIQDNEIVKKTDEEIEAEKAEEEANRTAKLSLTAADVERALYKAFGKDFDDIVDMVTQLQPEGLDIKALKIELKANNFYRGNSYVDAIGALLGITSAQLDEFFQTNDYTKLMPADIEEETETTEEET